MNVTLIPIWLLTTFTFVVVMLAIEAGYRLGEHAHRRAEDEKESPVSAIVGAILGLLAFVLAFTFSIVAERYDARKALVRDEANAVRTTWLRADFLPDADRDESKELLRGYLDARVAAAQSGTFDPERVRQVVADAERTQVRLWRIAVSNAHKDLNSDVAALYVESLNDLFGVHASRVAVSLQMRIPLGIWLTLYCMTMLGMMSVGYQTGIAASKRSMARPLLAFSFTVMIAIIAALDRPDNSYVRVSQQPLIDLQAWLDNAALP